MSEAEYDALLLESVDEALSMLSDSITKAVYFHLERSFNIKKDEIPCRLGAFTQAVENIFGVGANFVEILIMKKLHEKVNAHFRWDESKGFELAQARAPYISEAKRVFENKNVIKTIGELV